MKSIGFCERTLVENKENKEEVKKEIAISGVEEKLNNGNFDDKKLVLQNGIKASEVVVKTESNGNDFGVSDNKSDIKLFADLKIKEEPPEISLVTEVINGKIGKEEESSSLLTNGSSSNDSLVNNKKNCKQEISPDLNTHSSSSNDLEKEDKSEILEDETKTVEEICIMDESFEEVDDAKAGNVTEAEEVNEIVDIVIDDDENKENEKDEKVIILKNEAKSSEECNIQVGKCQTVTDSDKKSIWLVKSEEDAPLASEAKDSRAFKVESVKEEDEIQEVVQETADKEMEVDDTQNSEVKDVENVALMEEDNCYLNKTIEDSGLEDNISDSPSETPCSRKRQMSSDVEEAESIAKKKKWSEIDVETEEEEEAKKEKKAKDSNRLKSSTNKKALDASKVTKQEVEAVEILKDQKSTRIMTRSKSMEESSKSEQEMIFKSSFLSSLREKLKTLTRSDLEELVLQKLCEAITERSNVGILRRKAQDLEQEQEKWKTKVGSLTKLITEMEMVMKKYMTEVENQKKIGDVSIVTPLKVTRSVGLQVSFFPHINRPPIPTSQQLATPTAVQNTNGKITRKLPSPQSNAFPKPVANKTPNQKNTVPLQKSPVAQQQQQKEMQSLQKAKMQQQQELYIRQQKKCLASRNEYCTSQSNQNSVTTNSSPSQTQGMRPLNKPSNVAYTVQQHIQQQQQQNGSKVIDLTDDDDRQTGNLSITKISNQVRVVPIVHQTQGNKYTYVLPSSNTPVQGASAAQSRQVVIATPTTVTPPNRQTGSATPLFFKGGNVVQTPGNNQSPMANQSGLRAPPPKLLKHPAPLPQPPVNTPCKPNLKLRPPKPSLKISRVKKGIVLSWNMGLTPEHASISSYQLFAYQETDSPPCSTLWKKVGQVDALPLPMACTLTQFMSGHKYHFAVRAVDFHSRVGPFSQPGTIVLSVQ